jgi:hypothetical protein
MTAWFADDGVAECQCAVIADILTEPLLTYFRTGANQEE